MSGVIMVQQLRVVSNENAPDDVIYAKRQVTCIATRQRKKGPSASGNQNAMRCRQNLLRARKPFRRRAINEGAIVSGAFRLGQARRIEYWHGASAIDFAAHGLIVPPFCIAQSRSWHDHLPVTRRTLNNAIRNQRGTNSQRRSR